MTHSSPMPRRGSRPAGAAPASPAICLRATLAVWVALAGGLGALAVPAAAQAQAAAARPSGDYIVAIVNQELVTAGEVEQRLARVREGAARTGARLPPLDELRRQVLDALIEERVQITFARENGPRIDELEIDRAVANVAAQNQVTLPQLRERLRAEGIDYARFRSNLKDQLLVERVREREVQARIRISDGDIDAWLDQQRAQGTGGGQLNLAQVLITVPEGAAEAVVAERRAKAEAVQARIKAGEPFDKVAREVSEDGNKAQGGEIGLRPADRLPDVFVEQVKGLKTGDVSPTLLRTGAGFHLLKVLERLEAGALSVQQTRVRHILLRPSAQLSQDAAVKRLAGVKQQIQAGTKRFDQVARESSEDSTAAQGGDLGWASPGMFVPEFEEAMAGLPPGGISDPVVSRFGVHLIQVQERRSVALDAKQQREQARNVLREQKYEEAYADWNRELRARAYVELRDAPP